MIEFELSRQEAEIRKRQWEAVRALATGYDAWGKEQTMVVSREIEKRGLTIRERVDENGRPKGVWVVGASGKTEDTYVSAQKNFFRTRFFLTKIRVRMAERNFRHGSKRLDRVFTKRDLKSVSFMRDAAAASFSLAIIVLAASSDASWWHVVPIIVLAMTDWATDMAMLSELSAHEVNEELRKG